MVHRHTSDTRAISPSEKQTITSVSQVGYTRLFDGLGSHVRHLLLVLDVGSLLLKYIMLLAFSLMSRMCGVVLRLVVHFKFLYSLGIA